MSDSGSGSETEDIEQALRVLKALVSDYTALPEVEPLGAQDEVANAIQTLGGGAAGYGRLLNGLITVTVSLLEEIAGLTGDSTTDVIAKLHARWVNDDEADSWDA
ncbi:MAG TPA: hypothetical protein VN886_08885 [Acidimicrobiales bacterium]|nr:hypothetical protein [Acidimicrobiales bacterium]